MSLMAGGCIAGASSVSLKAAPLAPVAVGYRLLAVTVAEDEVDDAALAQCNGKAHVISKGC